MEKALYLPTEQSTTLFAVIGNPWALLGIWLVLINLVTFLVLSILGGSIGALLGMRVFHHKTLHRSFRYGIPAILILQILIPVGIAIWRLLAG